MGKYTETPMTMDQIMKSFVSGGIAGMISKTFIAPFERIKFLYVVTYVADADSLHRIHLQKRLQRSGLYR